MIYFKDGKGELRMTKHDDNDVMRGKNYELLYVQKPSALKKDLVKAGVKAQGAVLTCVSGGFVLDNDVIDVEQEKVERVVLRGVTP